MILLLEPFFSSRPWHGTKLSRLYNCPPDTGEAWICSGIKGKSSKIINGEFSGKTLEEFFNDHKSDLFKMPNEPEFPILLKIIDADSDLSIQVHPDNDYAKMRHNGNGKFECWYFLDENTAGDVIIGTSCTNKEELQNAIDNKTIMNVLNSKKIKPGSYVSIVPGTIHALKGGSYVLETQQPSDITYRLYDYDRKPLRELHIEDSLNVIDFTKTSEVYDYSNDSIDENKYFIFEKKSVNGNVSLKYDNVVVIYVMAGEGKINNLNVKKNDTLMLLNEEKVEIEGNMSVGIAVPKKIK